MTPVQYPLVGIRFCFLLGLYLASRTMSSDVPGSCHFFVAKVEFICKAQRVVAGPGSRAPRQSRDGESVARAPHSGGLALRLHTRACSPLRKSETPSTYIHDTVQLQAPRPPAPTVATGCSCWPVALFALKVKRATQVCTLFHTDFTVGYTYKPIRID